MYYLGLAIGLLPMIPICYWYHWYRNRLLDEQERAAKGEAPK